MTMRSLFATISGDGAARNQAAALQQHDSSGALLRNIALPVPQRLKHLAFDDAVGAVWLAAAIPVPVQIAGPIVIGALALPSGRGAWTCPARPGEGSRYALLNHEQEFR